MFKKHMTPLSKNGTLSNEGKAPNAKPLAAAAGGGSSLSTYAKATPMANPQPAPVPDGLGSGSWGGNGI